MISALIPVEKGAAPAPPPHAPQPVSPHFPATLSSSFEPPREHQNKFEKIWDELVSDPEARERLQIMEKEGGAVDQRIWAVFQTTCKYF
jgi:hypothetical protein